MIREEYLRRLIDEAHVELYLSAIDGARLFWPWRMQPPKSASKRYRNACEKYVIDSDPLHDDVTTEDVLDCAYRMNAEVASLADVYQDKDATVDSLLNGLEVADDHKFDGTLLLPLQDPFSECWKELGEPTNHWIGLGGLKDASPQRRITATRSLRDTVGNDVWLHGFGWGVDGIADTIRQEPHLLDSLDYSTPVQSSPHGDASSGQERMSVVAAYAGYRLIKDLREVSSYTEHTAEDVRDESQQGLGGFT